MTCQRCDGRGYIEGRSGTGEYLEIESRECDCVGARGELDEMTGVVRSIRAKPIKSNTDQALMHLVSAAIEAKRAGVSDDEIHNIIWPAYVKLRVAKGKTEARRG